MNKKNLMRTYNLILKTDWRRIDMGYYRTEDDMKNPECGSVGCIIGHATSLDHANVLNHFIDREGKIDFLEWSKSFFEIDNIKRGVWSFLFAGDWHLLPVPPQQQYEQMLARMKFVIEGRFHERYEMFWQEMFCPYLYQISKKDHPELFDKKPYEI